MEPDYPHELYQVPLDPRRREIRLLTIQESEENMVLCTLRTVSLDENPRFHALSYTWGDPKVKKRIKVNGRIAFVTVNLEGALQSLRDFAGIRNIWVDALCINQMDNREKSNQVPLMGEIFTKAKQVIAWIGKGDQTSTAFIHAVEELSQADITRDIRPSRAILKTITRAHMLSSSVLTRPYWERMWIVQELALTRTDAVILCGHTNTSIGLESFSLGVFRIWNNMKYLNHTSEDWLEVKEQCIQQGLYPKSLDLNDTGVLGGDEWATYVRVVSFTFARFMVQNQKVDMGNLLTMTNDRLATNPADKVYGLLGMLLPKDRDRIKVDYESSHMVAFRDFISAIWCGPFTESVTHWDYGRQKPCVRNYPSWVPDLCHQPKNIAERAPSGKNPWTRGIQPRISHDSQYIIVGGVLVDHIILADNSAPELLTVFTPEERLTNPLSLQVFGRIQMWVTQFADRVLVEGEHPLHVIGDQRTVEPPWKVLLADSILYIPDGLTEQDFTTFWTDVFAASEPVTRLQEYLSRVGAVTGALLEQTLNRFYTDVLAMVTNRKIIYTGAGFSGVGPEGIQAGDSIVVLRDFSTPLALREQPGGYYTMIGACHLSGLMDFAILEPFFDQGRLKGKVFKIG